MSQRVYRTALYLRLSRDDTDIDGRSKTESNSISSQRDLLHAYVQRHSDLQIYDTYIDDGYSGADFHRPEFERMMKDIYAGKVNCVLVKDLSRFGRDYIEAGRLIQKTFPAFCVRFIAVTDYYDSLIADRTESGLVLPVKNFINDSYCRDISVKVRAHQRVKRLEGKCIAAFTVYGYLKDPEDKNSLIVDAYAGEIVKMIYAWKIKGMSLGGIAKKLNHLGIFSPMEYKRGLGMKYATGFESGMTAKWAAQSVKRILTNRVYLGDMEQGKQEKISYKLKKRVKKPQEEWICVRHTHEAIIEEWDYRSVQELLKYDGRISQGTDTANLFTGILVCADCGAPMIKRVNICKNRKKIFYICQTKNKALGCSRHSIEEEILKKIVQKEITYWLTRLLDPLEVEDSIRKIKIKDDPIKKHEKQLIFYQKELAQYEIYKEELQKDFVQGRIEKEGKEELDQIYTERRKELGLAIHNQRDFIEEMRKKKAVAEATLEEIKRTGDIYELTRELLITMVHKIYVHENKKLTLVFRFSNNLSDGLKNESENRAKFEENQPKEKVI